MILISTAVTLLLAFAAVGPVNFAESRKIPTKSHFKGTVLKVVTPGVSEERIASISRIAERALP
jgi:hypothetical protein